MSLEDPFPRIQMAVLCDFATVREGLLHVLGGGITRLWRPHLPAPLGLTLALLAEVPADTAQSPHQFEVEIKASGGERIASVSGGFGVRPGPRPLRLEPNEAMVIPSVVPLLNVGVSRHGRYSLEVTVDGTAARALQFWVLHPEELALPPLNLPEA